MQVPYSGHSFLYKNIIREYQERNPSFFQHYAVKLFLEKPYYYQLFEQAVCEPTPDHQKKLNQAFQHYYFQLKFVSYVSQTLYYTAINFDKKNRQHKERMPLIVDDVTNHEKSLLSFDTTIQDFSFISKENFEFYFNDEKLIKAIDSLSDKQKELILLSYVHSYNDTEIARKQHKTQQAVSKNRKRTLTKLHEMYIEMGED
ncbi:sigma-70 family RNA polymerase sigma factor [Priestia megaterium]|uniref:sigma-70 family RNA polymerase sigma factor n=1 Tax=Priestia megaterium TaxID=1404 RepID=UPI00203F9DC8|nr:sigma-70 family RNA polymerase sigma factor [Priestia megaterium]MCM3196901.1 sigma-70 family RNA polymerase sigma factor [Priestia megaterium]